MGRRPSRARGGAKRATLVGSLALVLLALAMLREPIGRWLFPDAALEGLLAEAESALEAGETAEAARRLLAAQARSPDHPRLAEGLARGRDGALAAAAAALARGELDRARAELALADALGAPGERVLALRRQVEARAEPAVEALLKRAVAREASDPDGALADYQRALERDPRSAVARAGRARLLDARLRDADAALVEGDVARAVALVDGVRAIDPAHLGLPDLAVRLARHGAAPAPREAAPPPAGDPRRAADAARWRGLAEEAMGRGAWDEARRALDRARALDPDAPELAALDARMDRAGHGAR